MEESIEEAVSHAVGQHSLSLGSHSLEQCKSDSTYVEFLISAVLKQVQSLIMKAVAVAIASTTETVIQNLKQEIAEAKTVSNDVEILKVRVEEQKAASEKLEQYTRKENVKIFGLNESENENLEEKVVILSKEAGVDITSNDISVCHRLPGNGSGPRPVIVKFVRRKTKASIMKSKKNLRTKPDYQNVYVSDDLTSTRMKIVKGLRNEESASKVWTIDRKIYCVLNTDGKETKLTLNSVKDIAKLPWSEDKVRELQLYNSL